MAGPVRVQVVCAWPRRHEAVDLVLAEGATVADAIAASGFDPAGSGGLAVHSERAQPDRQLRDGDRIELLRPLQADPKEARRRRAARGKPQP